MVQASNTPTGWDDDISPMTAPHGAAVRSVQFDEETSAAHIHRQASNQDDEHGHTIRRRRSSITAGFDAIRTAGGPNSIENFARSWQRAIGFHELTPRSSHTEDGGEDGQYSDSYKATSSSVIRDRLAAEEAGFGHEVAAEESGESDTIHGEGSSRRVVKRGGAEEEEEEDILAIAPHLASPFGANYGTSYGSLASRSKQSSMVHAAKLWRQTIESGVQPPDKERSPLLVKRVLREDGKAINVVIGQSTLPQTVVNSVNVLIGVGLLSLPLGFKYSGWLIGMIYFLFCALVTQYTARILGKCLDVDKSLITFGDLGYISFGPRARILISILLSLELGAACVALVVLFADSLDALIPGLGVLSWKYLLDLSVAIPGLLMFGNGVHEEITSNIFLTDGYPKALSVLMVVFISIIPLTKIPLSARPIISTIEVFAGLDVRSVSSSTALVGMSGLTRGILKTTVRALTMVLFVIIAIAFPSFHRIMALLGSALTFSISVLLPLAVYLRIFGDKISLKERILDYILIAVSAVIAVVGTAWAVLPTNVTAF
ncbi:MAG: hypothetical protein M1816_000272 [Peltula sp. TS41687]|nr:MAG: hypothetical protein M1816_000272 [Peltula sp. TS41687]